MAANRPLAEIPRSTDLSQLCGRRRGAVAGALGAQLRPKRGRSASRGLPRAARGPGAPRRPRRRRPARSAANGAAPKSTAPRSRGGSRCRCRARWRPGAETASRGAAAGSRRPPGWLKRGNFERPQIMSRCRRLLLCAGAALGHLPTGYIKLIATVELPLGDEDEPPAPTALGARPAWCARPPRLEAVRMSP